MLEKYRLNLHIFFIILFWALPANVVLATEMNRITRENGLAGESVNKIITDHRGMMWLATSNGVSCFNGVFPMTIPIADSDHDDHRVYDICEDEHQVIYISTPTGLYHLRKGDKAFSRITSLDSKASLLYANQQVYVVSRNGILMYDGQKVKEADFGIKTKGLVIRSLTKDDSGNLWLLTDSELFLIEGKQLKKKYSIAELSNLGVPLAQIMACGKQLWLSTKGSGLYRFDPTTRQTTRIEGIGNVVNDISDAGNGKLCVATDGAGAFLLNVDTGEIEHHIGKEQEDGGLPTDAIYCYLRDSQGNDWVGLSRYGLAYTHHKTLLANIYSIDSFSTKGLNVNSFCIYGKECLIGTHNGLIFVNEAQGTVHHFTPNQLGGGHIVLDIVRYCDDYYIATFDGGLWKLKSKNLSLSRVSTEKSLVNASIGVLRISPDGKLWIGASTGVFVLDSTGTITSYNEKNLRLNNVTVSAIVFDPQGNAWICSDQGIAVFDKQSNRFVDDFFPKGFFNGLGYLRGCTGKDNQMYFGNRAIYYTDSRLEHFGRLPISDKLLSESLDDLLSDNQGNLWMTTEKGLFRMTQNLKNTLHFGYSEGISSQIFGRNSLWISDKNDLWFATADGLQWLSLSDIDKWKQAEKSRVLLYDIIRGEHSLSPTEILDANDNQQLRLSWSMESELLRMKVALQDYGRPDDRFFEYRLDGRGDWTVIEAGETIVIDALWMGNHQLTVRLMGIEGTETTYTISVYPSTITIVISILILATTMLLILLRRERNSSHDLRKERNFVEEALIETEQELEMVKSKEVKGDEQTGKYQRMRISEEESADIVARMRSWLESSRAYTNPELKRSDIADELKVPVAKLSQIFTLYLNENYYDFVNAYRLSEFKRLIAEEAYKRFTLTALSEQCGFKKSSFFSTFRKHEGMTPTEYLKRHNIKMRL